jgi:hypothetical protein
VSYVCVEAPQSAAFVPSTIARLGS